MHMSNRLKNEIFKKFKKGVFEDVEFPSAAYQKCLFYNLNVVCKVILPSTSYVQVRGRIVRDAE
jgi:hypothetical protein